MRIGMYFVLPVCTVRTVLFRIIQVNNVDVDVKIVKSCMSSIVKGVSLITAILATKHISSLKKLIKMDRIRTRAIKYQPLIPVSQPFHTQDSVAHETVQRLLDWLPSRVKSALS